MILRRSEIEKLKEQKMVEEKSEILLIFLRVKIDNDAPTKGCCVCVELRNLEIRRREKESESGVRTKEG